MNRNSEPPPHFACGFLWRDVSSNRRLPDQVRRVETVMQRLELSQLAKSPSSQRSLITEGPPVVLEIEVTEAKNAEKRSKDEKE